MKNATLPFLLLTACTPSLEPGTYDAYYRITQNACPAGVCFDSLNATWEIADGVITIGKTVYRVSTKGEQVSFSDSINESGCVIDSDWDLTVTASPVAGVAALTFSGCVDRCRCDYSLSLTKR